MNTNATKTKATPLLALACAVPLAATACGGSSNASSHHAPAGPTTVTTAPAASPTRSALRKGVLASIELNGGSAPGGVVVGGGAVWAYSHRGSLLFRIDPKQDRVAARIDLGQDACGEVIYGAHRVFVSPCDDSTKTKVVDARTNQVVGQIGNSAAGGSAWFAFGSVWITAVDMHHVLRVDPTTLKVVATIKVPSVDFVDDGHSMWFAETDSSANYTDRLDQVDPSTNRIVRRLRTHAGRVGSDPWLEYAASRLWLKGNDRPTLIAISPATGAVTTYTIKGWHALDQEYDEEITVGLGSLWIRISDGKVARINPTDGRVVRRYPADGFAGGGYGVVGFGSLWVANFGTDTVWRDRLT
jgi:streptogramin lyase